MFRVASFQFGYRHPASGQLPTGEPMNKRETATVLAALRHWQAFILEHPEGDQGPLDEIATDGGTIEPMPPDEIDVLCERLNFTGHPNAIQDAAIDQLDHMRNIWGNGDAGVDMMMDVVVLFDALHEEVPTYLAHLTEDVAEIRAELEAANELKF